MASVPAPDRIRGGVIYGLYALADASRSIRYIGKTVRDPRRRLAGHLHTARGGSNTPVAKWIRKHGGAVGQVIIESCEAYEDLCAAEIRLIAEMGTLTTRGGLNCTSGGDGSLGWVNGPEAIEKIRSKAVGRKRSPESIAKAAASRAGWRPSKETRALWSEQRKGRTFSDEARTNMRKSRARGADNHNSKLTAEQVSGIKSRLWDGEAQIVLAEEHGVRQPAISSIAREATWAHVPWPTDRPRTIVTASRRRATLSDDTVREIRARAANGDSYSTIAGDLNVGRSQVGRIVTRERYRHVRDLPEDSAA